MTRNDIINLQISDYQIQIEDELQKKYTNMKLVRRLRAEIANLKKQKEDSHGNE